MAAQPAQEGYPSIQGASESNRLQAQHHLVEDALGDIILCPIDLSRSNLRVLDSGTADGFWLLKLREQLGHPESATLIGTDISPSYPKLKDLPSNISLRQQSILDEWPEEWQDSFDLVHMRHTFANAGTFEEAVRVAQRLTRLVKPGGWLQFVDGTLPQGPIESDDPPSMRLFKTLGGLAERVGLNMGLGARVAEILRQAGGLEMLGSKEAHSTLVTGARTDALKESGYAEIDGWFNALAKVTEDSEELSRLKKEVLEEAETTGFKVQWFSAWGRRPG